MAIRKIISRSITDGAVVATDVAALSIDSTKLASNAVTNAKIASNAISSDKLDTNIQFGFKNRIINGDMRIDQRNAGASVNIAVDSQYTIDRWRSSTSQGSKLSAQRVTTSPAGFSNSYLYTVTTPVASLGANDYFGVLQSIEGFNLSDIGFGTANAKTITISFWVRASITGTYSVAIHDSISTRNYIVPYTINDANTFEYKTVTIPGDTTGTWNKDNSSGMVLYFTVGMGSTYGSGSTNTWNAALKLSAPGQVNLLATSGATFYLTGVQLEVGSSATSFDTRAYGTEFDLCRRYYEQVVMNIGTSGNSTTSVNTSFSWYPKRATPTLGQTGLMGVTLTGVGNYTQTASSVVGAFTPNGGTVTLGNFTGLTAQYSYYANTNLNTNQITVSSEL